MIHVAPLLRPRLSYSRATHGNIAIETMLLWAAPMKADSDRLIAGEGA
jgi:hypothetical protein